MFTRILIGIIITTISFLILKYNEWFIRQVGSWSWAERHIGTEGGSRLVYKLIAVFGIIIGLLTIADLHVRFLKWFFAPLVRFSGVIFGLF